MTGQVTGRATGRATGGAEAAIRADKWLWYARFFKTRTLASKVCAAGQLRLSGSLVAKAHQKVKVGDVLTFPQGCHIRVVKVRALGNRRGPASEAQSLYEDLRPPTAETRLPRDTPVARRAAGSGRPTKTERRALGRLTGERLTREE